MPVATTTRDEIILEHEKSYWDAMKSKNGRRTAELSGATSLVTGPRGVMSIAKAQMGKMTEDPGWELKDYTLSDLQILHPSLDVSIIAYKARQRMLMGGKEQESESILSSTWVRTHGSWECHAHSETPLGQ